MAQQTWFVVRGGNEEGPYTGQQLKQMAASGKLRPNDKIRRSDVETARPASAVRGLFPEGEAAGPTQPKSSDADQPQSQRPSSRRWIIIGSVVAAVLFLSCGGLMVLGLVITLSEREAAKKEFAEAERLWASGKKEEAAVKYRSALKGVGKREKAVAYGRLIDGECEAGNTEAAKALLAEASAAGVTPEVTHAEATALLAASRQVLTADYLPCIAGTVKKYDEERYDASTGRLLTRTSDTITCLDGNKMLLQWTTMSPGQPPTGGKGEVKLEEKGGMIEWLGRIVIKPGARPGDEWNNPRGAGTYKLIRFDKGTAQVGGGKTVELERAVIEYRTSSDFGGSRTEYVTEYVLERGNGIVSEKENVVRGGDKKLTRDRRLSSSTSP